MINGEGVGGIENGLVIREKLLGDQWKTNKRVDKWILIDKWNNKFIRLIDVLMKEDMNTFRRG